MAGDNMHDWVEGDPIMADWLQAMVETIRANRVILSGPGLVGMRTPSGQQVSLSLVPEIRYAIITTAVPAYSEPSSVKTLGKGAGTIYSLVYSTTGVATLVTTGLTAVPIYSAGKDIIPVGNKVMVHQVQGQMHAIVEFCQ